MAGANLLAGCSIELSPRDPCAGPDLAGLLPAATKIFVNNPPNVTHHDIVASCVRLASAGFVPVPHIVARHLTSYTQANDFLARVAGEAGVAEVLLLGGDALRPTGPFATAFELLSTGIVERNGIRSVAFAGYPEGHPRIATTALDTALQAKTGLARVRGLGASIVTQFGFEADPILRWIDSLPARGITCTVRIGLAGPASVATLANYAIRCGIGNSLRSLARGHTAFARILTEANPAALIETLALRLPPDSTPALHLFTFGGVRRTAAWLSEFRV